MAWLVWTVGALIVLVAVIAFLQRFYRKSTRDMALVRTGAGGQCVALDGGLLSLPFLHRVDEISMRTHKLEVRRAGDKGLMTEDRLRVDVDAEFHVRVQPSAQGVALAAQAFGARVLRSEELHGLLQGRFADALQAVAAGMSLDALVDQRAAFVRAVKDAVRDDLGAQGLSLENVSLTRLDQTPASALNENNAFNAVGLRKLAEVVATHKKRRAQIEADADVSVRQTLLDSIKQKLLIDQQEQQAQLAQRLELEQARVNTDSQAARAREQGQRESEAARIAREREVKSAEIARDLELDRQRLQARLNTELLRVEQAIALAARQSDEAAASALAEVAKIDWVLAQERVVSERERAVQQRQQAQAQAQAVQERSVDVQRVAMEGERALAQAKVAAAAQRERAAAERERLLAQAEGQRAVIEAENLASETVLRMKLEMHRIDRMPELAAQMVKPIEKIESIRIHQISGLPGLLGAPGTAGTSGAGGSGSPVNDLLQGVMGMALQMPTLKRLGESLGLDIPLVGAPAAPRDGAG